jgi:hypothetical protein
MAALCAIQKGPFARALAARDRDCNGQLDGWRPYRPSKESANELGRVTWSQRRAKGQRMPPPIGEGKGRLTTINVSQ